MRRRFVIAASVLSVSFFLVAGQVGGQPPGAPISERRLDGRSVFQAYCAPCHGADGKGQGPVAASLKVAPSDLTLIARSNAGMFPRATMEDILIHGGKWKAHGSNEMPIWGQTFLTVDANEKLQTARVANVVAYIESIQIR